MMTEHHWGKWMDIAKIQMTGISNSSRQIKKVSVYIAWIMKATFPGGRHCSATLRYLSGLWQSFR